MMRSLAIALLALALLDSDTNGQQLDSTVQFFAPLLDRTWVGRYVDSPDEAHLRHVVRWRALLGGKVVKKVKAVATLDYCEVSLHYWDPARDRVAFVSLTNRGQSADGSVKPDSGHIVLSGNRATGGPFVSSFAVLPDGRLRDRFFRVIDGDLQQGHVIEYTADPARGVGEALECEFR